MTTLIAPEIREQVFSQGTTRRLWDDSWFPAARPFVSPEAQNHDVPFSFSIVKIEESAEETSRYFSWLDSVETFGEIEGTTDQLTNFDHRIEVLKKQAELEGNWLSHASQMAFSEFLRANPFLRYGRLVLMENGNLRAVWKGEGGTHIGLQFLGDGSIQYVIFKRRKPSQPVSRAFGRDTIDGIRGQIEVFQLHGVLYA